MGYESILYIMHPKRSGDMNPEFIIDSEEKPVILGLGRPECLMIIE